jgi:hypothetical protein
MGSLRTEPAAIAIGAMLLAKEILPMLALKYAEIRNFGIAFVNVSVGGTLTHIAAPPVLIVAYERSWGLGRMFFEFVVRATFGIALNTILYFLMFRKEFKKDARQTPWQ